MTDIIGKGYIHQVPESIPYSQGNVYIGIGLSGKKLVSERVPFDILAYILSSIIIQRHFQLDEIYILIADIHAQKNVFSDTDNVSKKAEELQYVITRILEAFRIHNCSVLKASQITCNDLYQEKLKEYKKVFSNDYVARELVDIWYFHNHLDTRVKMSWKDPNGKLTFDESYFDSKVSLVESQSPEFVYTKPGFDFRSRFNYVSPYTMFGEQERIQLFPYIPFSDQIFKIQSQSTLAKLQKGEKLLQEQIEVIESVWQETIPGQTVWDKVQYIGEDILKV